MSTVVLLHGFTGSPRSWDWVREHLRASSAHVVIVPLYGHDAERGNRDSNDPWEYRDEVRRLAQIVRASRPPVIVSGYSLGARLALSLLIDHPNIVAGGVLVGVHPGLAEPQARAQRRLEDADWVRCLREEGLEDFLQRWENLPLWDTQANVRAERLQHQREQRRGHRGDALARALEVLGLAEMPPTWTSLSRIDIPVELVVGALDHKFRELAVRMAEGGPMRIRIAESCGHNLLYEAPEVVAEALGRMIFEVSELSANPGKQRSTEGDRVQL